MVWMWAIIASWLVIGFALILNISTSQTINWPLAIAAVLGMLALSTLQHQIRCPKCRLKVWSDGGPGPQVKAGRHPKSNCPCGRNRVWIWPLQYLIRPENRA
jgi:hypothetical protein